jgi:hypothetical protein
MPIIIFIVLSFFSLSLALEKVQTKPGQVTADRLEKAKLLELPDLVVDNIWLDNQCNINFKLRNIGKGNIPDEEHKNSLVRIQFGSEIKDFPLPRIDSNGVLKKPGGSVSFNTQIVLKSSVDMKVIVDFNKKIKESDAGEKNNEKVEKLTPQCPSVAKVDLKTKILTDEGAKSQTSDMPLQKSKTLTIPPLGKTGTKADTFPIDGIKIDNPDQNTYINQGFNLSIEWEALGLAANYKTFRIELYDPSMGKMARKISPDNGISFSTKQAKYSYTWEVPEELFLQKAIVRIGTMDGKYSADSAIFNILPSVAKKIPGTSIKVTAPTGGSIWVKESTYPIKWKSPQGSSGYRKIELLDTYGNLIKSIADKIVDAGDGTELSYSWKVLPDISNDKYQIKISSNDNKYVGYSADFFVTDQGSPAITVIKPSKGDIWDLGKAHVVQWNVKGTVDTKANIFFYYPNTPLDPSNKNKTWEGPFSAQTYMGYTSIFLGPYAPIYVLRGPVRVRVQTADGKVYGDSEIFNMGKSSISVTSPSKGDILVPLKPYTVQWNISGISAHWSVDGYPGSNTVNIWLVPQSTASEKILVAKGLGTPQAPGNDNYNGTFTAVLGNVQSGNYFIRVEQFNNSLFYGDSPSFTVKSALSSDTAFLIPDSGQNQVDFALLKVFYDGIETGDLVAKIKNKGNDYKGSITITYQFANPQTNKYDIKGDKSILVDIKHNQEMTIPFLFWDQFSASYGLQYGQLGIPKRGPTSGNVSVWGGDDINPSDNTISVMICKTPKADIGTDGYMHFTFMKNHIYIYRGTTNQINAWEMKWISNDTFEAKLEVGLWNYGCVSRTFDCWLYVDKLPGQLIKKVTLNPGQTMKFNETVKIKVPYKSGTHQLVFIADPDEAKNEPYPNSYRNNFIIGNLKILTEGTVTGSQ